MCPSLFSRRKRNAESLFVHLIVNITISHFRVQRTNTGIPLTVSAYAIQTDLEHTASTHMVFRWRAFRQRLTLTTYGQISAAISGLCLTGAGESTHSSKQHAGGLRRPTPASPARNIGLAIANDSNQVKTEETKLCLIGAVQSQDKRRAVQKRNDSIADSNVEK